MKYRAITTSNWMVHSVGDLMLIGGIRYVVYAVDGNVVMCRRATGFTRLRWFVARWWFRAKWAVLNG